MNGQQRPARILVTGATGLLGRALMRELRAEPGFEVVGCALSRARGEILRVDLLDGSEVRRLFAGVKPSCVIHAAAHRRPDVCDADPSATTALNVNATRVITEAARNSGAWTLYISTDYVFDGTRPPYRVDDPSNPINHYGRTKLQGEIATLHADPRNCSLRIPILYGPVESLDESPVTILARDVCDPRPKLVEHWATRFPTHAGDVAVVCRQIILRKREDPALTGIFHWRGGEAMTKYEMALAIAGVLKRSASHLRPDDRPPAGAPRPKNTMLDCSRLEALGIGRRTPFREGIAEALGRFC